MGQVRTILKFLFTAQAIQAAGIDVGSDLVRKMAVNAAGWAEEVFKPTQEGKIGTKDMVRKLAVNAAGLPEELKPVQDDKIGEIAMVRQVTSNTAALPEEASKLTQHSMTSGSGSMRTAAAA